MGVAACHMINGKRGKLHLTIKRFWLVICRARPLWVMPFLRQLGRSCQTDYKLHFCNTEARSPACKKARALSSFKVTHPATPGLQKVLCGAAACGTAASSNGGVGGFGGDQSLLSICFASHTALMILPWLWTVSRVERSPFKSSLNWPSWSFIDWE